MTHHGECVFDIPKAQARLETEQALEKYWKAYLNPRDKAEIDDAYFRPPITYARGFRDGVRYAEGIHSPNEFVCPSCKRASYPDYGRCAFCGVGG